MTNASTKPTRVTLTLTPAQAETVRFALEWARVRIRDGEDLPCVPLALVLRVLVLLADAMRPEAKAPA